MRSRTDCWGSPIVWSLAAHYPERVTAVASLSAKASLRRIATMFDQRQRFAKGENPWIPLLVDGSAPTVARDEQLLTAADAGAEYTHYPTENGGFEVPNYYYQNHA